MAVLSGNPENHTPHTRDSIGEPGLSAFFSRIVAEIPTARRGYHHATAEVPALGKKREGRIRLATGDDEHRTSLFR